MNGLWLIVGGVVVLDVLVGAWVVREWRAYQWRRFFAAFDPAAMGEAARQLGRALQGLGVSFNEAAIALRRIGEVFR